MRRSTLFSGTLSLYKAGFAGAFVLATILSCSDTTTAPAPAAPNPLGGYTAGGPVPDSIKYYGGAFSSSSARVASRIANVMAASSTSASSASVSGPTYTVSSVEFTPEPAPQFFVLKSDDETHFKTEIGFDFTFYNNTYHLVNISANGFVAFDSIPQFGGCCDGHVIPFAGDRPYNNLIALAWTDLNSATTGDIRAETQGVAPHRKFVVQYNNVQEFFPGKGHVTAQLVLSEGSNDITIYTFSQNILTFASPTTPFHAVTQGIENADGTEAEFLPGRVHSAFALTNDAVRFSFAHTNEPPVITAPSNVSVTTTPPASNGLPSFSLGIGSCTAAVNPGTATAIDDADGVTVVGVRSDGVPQLDAAYPKGITTITWTATDAGGLTATASQTVTVSDNEKPWVKAPADISTRIDRSATTATVVVGAAAAFDNCPDVTVAGARSDGAALDAAYPIGMTAVTWIATDASGNTSSANQQITVIGNKPPVIAAPLMLVVNTDPGVCVASVSVATPGVTDDTQGSTIVPRRSDGLPVGATYPKGITTITWTATDADGATSVATQTVAVNDNQKPSIQVPADISTRTDRSASTATVAVGSAAAADNCPDVSVAGARSDGVPLSAAFPIGLTTVTWTATDASGNTSSANQLITVVGNKPPVMSAPMLLVVNTDPGVCVASVSVATPGVTDDTEGSTIASRRNDGLPLSAAYPKGITTITWTVTDADGATAVATQTVTVNDREKPSVTSPANISKGTDPGLPSALVAVGSASAADNCHEVTVDGLRNDGAALDAPYNVGVTTISWMARDAAGNTATATQAITVLDVEAPTLNVPAGISVNATSAAGVVVNYNYSSSDNVRVTDGSCTPASGGQFPIGQTTVTCFARDAAGNRTSKSFVVTVSGSADQLMSLIEYVLSRNLPNGITNPLVAQLRAAARTGDTHVSCIKMSDFIKMVVKDGNGIPGDESSYMIDKATDIMGVLGCPDAATPTTGTRKMSM